MQTRQTSIPFQSITFSGVLILVILYLFRVDLELVYFANQPFFSGTASFFKTFLTYPGGMVEYLGLFAVQFYALKILPVVWVVALFGLLSFLTYQTFKESKNKSLSTITYLLFSVLFISDQGNYFHVPLFLWIGILTLVMNLIFIVLQRSSYIDYLYFFIIGLLIFYLSGTYGLVLFSFMQIGESINQKQYKKAAVFLFLMCLPVIIWVLMNWTAYRFIQLMRNLLPVNPLTTINQVILSVPFILLGVIVLLPFIKSVDKKMSENRTAKGIVIFLTWLTVLGILFKVADHSHLKKQLMVQKDVADHNWDKLLALDKSTICTPYMSMQSCRALYHKGQFLDELFKYPNYFSDTNLIVTKPMNAATAAELAEFYVDMGFISEARHWTNEALTASGYRPDLLKQLIVCDLILGKYATAEKYLNLLKTSPVNRKWAKLQYHYLSDSNFYENITYSRLRDLNPGVDFFASYTDPYSNLVKIVSDSVPNKMAFEYYIAYNLLRKNSQNVWQQIPKFHQLGYQRLPRSCQEAIIFFKATIGYTSTTDLFGYTYDEQIQKQFDEFSDIIFGRFNGDFSAAQSSLDRFKKTYWYYFLYQPVKGVTVSIGDHNYLN